MVGTRASAGRNRGPGELRRAFYEPRPLFPARVYELANAGSGLLLLRGKHPSAAGLNGPAIIYSVPIGTVAETGLFREHRY